jgi:multicomponent K+:H+ antiporter subunit E
VRLFFFMLAFWLVLNESVWPGHLLLGGALALGGALVYPRLEPSPRARRRPLAALRLIALVLDDIVRSNLAVARIVLGRGPRARRAGFMALPLEVSHPGAIAVIACIITATPGTSWVRYDRERNAVTIHVLDLADEHEWVRIFKNRYERPLMEIFQ